MPTLTDAAFMDTTAVAVYFVYAAATATGMSTAWTSPTPEHANKRFLRRPSGGVNK